jgi:hypothetical protein
VLGATDGFGAAAPAVLAQATAGGAPARPDAGGAGVVWAFIAMGLIIVAVLIAWRALHERSETAASAESVHEARTAGLEAGLGLERDAPPLQAEPTQPG